MKKRKELNALIGLGDSKRKKTKKGSGHRLLRTEPPGSESESSSDDDEFNSMNNEASFGKRNYTQCCNICYPLFLFIILAACVMACAGLIWMQIALKEDLDSLKEKMQTMDSSQKVSSHEISKLNEDLKTKQKKLDDVKNGDKGLNKLWSNLTEINRKISLLDSAVNHLKANIKSASDLINLPATVEELQKSVATIGSTLTSVQHDVNTMQASIENQKKYADELKTLDVTDLKEILSEANKTQELHQLWTDEQIHTLRSAIANLSQRMSAMEGSDQAAKYKALKDSEEAATTTKSVPDAEHDQAAQLAESQPTGLTQFLPVTRSKRDSGTGCPMTIFLPGVSSLEDLEDLFEQKGLALNSLIMSYQDLRGIFGKLIPNAHIMKCFDKDKDQRYSFVELKAATGF